MVETSGDASLAATVALMRSSTASYQLGQPEAASPDRQVRRNRPALSARLRPAPVAQQPGLQILQLAGLQAGQGGFPVRTDLDLQRLSQSADPGA
jgi:hypothetical protein